MLLLSFKVQGRDARGRWTSSGADVTVHIHPGELPEGLANIEDADFETAKGHVGAYSRGEDEHGDIHVGNVVVRSEDDDGDELDAHETLGRIDLHHVRRAIADQEHDLASRDLEAEAAHEAQQRQDEQDARHRDIHDVVDRLVANGWKPQTHDDGTLVGSLPEPLRGYGSPSSRQVIKDRLRHHGFVVKFAEAAPLLSLKMKDTPMTTGQLPSAFTIAPAEFKFEAAAGGLPVGEFKGYGAVFGNVDSHRDIIDPGAFLDSLAERKAQGRSTPMHVMHAFYGGDGLPIGVWKSIDEDEKGLRVHGKISGMNTDAGKLNLERLRDGAFGGLSIGYSVNPGGAIEGKGGDGEAVRRLKSLRLHEISLVDQPSNALARIDEIKRALAGGGYERKEVARTPHTDRAAASIAKALALHGDCMAGGDSPTAEERDQFLAHMQDAHEALTGARMPAGMKVLPDTIRGRETALRGLGFSRSQAEQIAAFSAKLQPRDEAASEQAANEARAAGRAASARKALDFLS